MSSERICRNDTVQRRQGLEEPLAVAFSSAKSIEPFGSGQWGGICPSEVAWPGRCH